MEFLNANIYSQGLQACGATPGYWCCWSTDPLSDLIGTLISIDQMKTHRWNASGAAILLAGLSVLVLLAGCGADPAPSASPHTGAPSASPSVSAGDESGVPTLWSDIIDTTAIPLGDGKVPSVPEIGYLDSCKTSFGGRGAPNGGPWIDAAAGTWDATSKVQVEGANSWPQATYSETVDAGTRHITASGVPTK